MLSQLLCIAVENGDLMRTIELLAHGADVREGGGWEGVKEQRREGEFLVDSFILFFFFLLLPPPFALSLSLSLLSLSLYLSLCHFIAKKKKNKEKHL